jgi:hypothetical protein
METTTTTTTTMAAAARAYCKAPEDWCVPSWADKDEVMGDTQAQFQQRVDELCAAFSLLTLRTAGMEMQEGARPMKRKRVSFAEDIDVLLVPVKEEQREETPETEAAANSGRGLVAETALAEGWARSPFPQDAGNHRPYYYNKETGVSQWCNCLRSKSSAKSCDRCKYVQRGGARQATPEQLSVRHKERMSA